MKQTTEQCLYLYHVFSGCVALVGVSSFRCKLGFSLESHRRLDCVVWVLTSRRKHFSFHCGRQSTAVNGLAESGRAVRSCRLLFFRSRSFLLLNKTSKQPASAVFLQSEPYLPGVRVPTMQHAALLILLAADESPAFCSMRHRRAECQDRARLNA